ncbi:hypothetical protein BH11BAC3_BH11BAC3_18200 [soil metagenome]
MKQEDKNEISLFVREGNEIREASEEDIKTAKKYYSFKEKGIVVDQKRITILTKKLIYLPGENIRIIHVLELLTSGDFIYAAGPKPVYMETVNGIYNNLDNNYSELDPFRPQTYNGKILKSPGIDFNFEILEYKFYNKGTYSIQWLPDKWKSNVIEIEIK